MVYIKESGLIKSHSYDELYEQEPIQEKFEIKEEK